MVERIGCLELKGTMAVTEPDSTNKVIPDNDKNATTLKRICFSDIDGTLVRLWTPYVVNVEAALCK